MKFSQICGSVRVKTSFITGFFSVIILTITSCDTIKPIIISGEQTSLQTEAFIFKENNLVIIHSVNDSINQSVLVSSKNLPKAVDVDKNELIWYEINDKRNLNIDFEAKGNIKLSLAFKTNLAAGDSIFVDISRYIT